MKINKDKLIDYIEARGMTIVLDYAKEMRIILEFIFGIKIDETDLKYAFEDVEKSMCDIDKACSIISDAVKKYIT